MDSLNRKIEPVPADKSFVPREDNPVVAAREIRGRILIIEDEEQVRKPIRLNLAKAGYEVREVANGAEAIELLKIENNACRVDTILCDIRMPRVNGLEAISYFREHYPSIPVVVLTGYPDVELAASLMRQGVLDYLVKPITREELLSVIERCVEQHSKP
jgi:two-component system chemotaxis response regulator CheY